MAFVGTLGGGWELGGTDFCTLGGDWMCFVTGTLGDAVSSVSMVVSLVWKISAMVSIAAVACGPYVKKGLAGFGFRRRAIRSWIASTALSWVDSAGMFTFVGKNSTVSEFRSP